MRKLQPRVLLVLGWYDYRLQRGVEQYAQEHGWHLSPDVTREQVIPWGWKGDGILAWLAAGDDLAEFVVRAQKPTVDFSFRRPHLKFPRVLYDHAASAHLVAEHFLSRASPTSFTTRILTIGRLKRGAMRLWRRCNGAGKECRWLRWRQPLLSTTASRYQEWKRKRKWLASELRAAAETRRRVCSQRLDGGGYSGNL